ncbi:MAG: redoxin domain-containing protein [Betaproteobacteria bacterium]|nr:redoxin domain-containing protein [Betaproteobacteria bacterium]
MVRKIATLLAITVACALGVTGCSKDPMKWDLVNITGIMEPLAFSLTDDHGQAVTQDDYRGKVALLYFGYTHCPDVCPTTLARLSQALSTMGSDADKVRVLFVTVDPKRDTADLLKTYTDSFGPQFVGLRTDDLDRLKAFNKRYRVTFGYGKPDADGNYEVSHSSAVFIFDQQGKARLIAEATDDVPAIAHDLKQLVSGN